MSPSGFAVPFNAAEVDDGVALPVVTPGFCPAHAGAEPTRVAAVQVEEDVNCSVHVIEPPFVRLRLCGGETATADDGPPDTYISVWPPGCSPSNRAGTDYPWKFEGPSE